MVTYKFNGAWVAEQPLTKEQKEAVKTTLPIVAKRTRTARL